MNFRDLTFKAINEMRQFPNGYNMMLGNNEILDEWISQVGVIVQLLNYRDFSGSRIKDIVIEQEGLYFFDMSCGFSGGWDMVHIPMEVLSDEDSVFAAKCIGLKERIQSSTNSLQELRRKVTIEEIRLQNLRNELQQVYDDKRDGV